jgi:hypothetical protein
LADVPICRNEYFVCTHIYALSGIPTHALDLAGDRCAAFFIVLAGNQISLPIRRGTSAPDGLCSARRMSSSVPVGVEVIPDRS